MNIYLNTSQTCQWPIKRLTYKYALSKNKKQKKSPWLIRFHTDNSQEKQRGMACERWSPFTENTESPQAETSAKITMKIWVVWPRKRNRKTHRGSHSKLDKIELCCESVSAGQFSIHPQKENGPGLSRPLSNREFCIERNFKKWCHTSYLKRIQQKNSIRIIFNHQKSSWFQFSC